MTSMRVEDLFLIGWRLAGSTCAAASPAHRLRMPRHSSGIVAASCRRSWSFRIAVSARFS